MRISKKIIITAFSTITAVVWLMRCTNPSAGTATETENVSSHMNFVKSDIPLNTSPQIASDLVDSLVKNNTRFAFDLYKNLRTTGGNIFFSPYSISENLAMVYAGAKNETAIEIAKALRFTMPDSIIHMGFDSINLSLAKWANRAGDTAYTLRNVNSIWMQESLSVQKSYLDLLSAYYNTGVYTVDFIRGYDSCTIAINTWMTQNSAGRINNLLPQNALTPLTRLVLVNALYFKSMWNDTFSVANTRDSTFSNFDSTKSTIPFMHAKGMECGYYETDRYQAVELLLAGWRTSMVIVLPKPGYFDAVENDFTTDTLDLLFSQLNNLADVTLSAPRFSFESGLYNLNNILSVLGMPGAFKSGTADFSGFDGRKDLFIGNVDHKGFIGVTEWGVEAVAATHTRIVSMGINPNKIMSIDHPFILFFRDRMTNTVLFMGRIVKL